MNRYTLGICAACAFVFVCAPGTAWSAGRAHEHGALKLNVTIDGPTLTIAMEAPLDSLLSFERAPRTQAERTAAADVLVRLRHPDKDAPLFVTDAAAQCTLSKAEVQAPVLELNPKSRAQDKHADLDALYVLTCAQPNELRSLEVGLFDVYKRIGRIDVQVAGPKGQSKASLKRPARKVLLVR